MVHSKQIWEVEQWSNVHQVYSFDAVMDQSTGSGCPTLPSSFVGKQNNKGY